MSKIIAIHSFRGGTGKSNITANLASILSGMGLRVGIVDTDIQSPGIHILFNLKESNTQYTLNDYLWQKCNISDCVYTINIDDNSLYFIPSSIRINDIYRIVKEGYNILLLNELFCEFIENYNLDILLIDTHPGISEEVLLTLAISDICIIVLRPDEQDIQGTIVLIDVARKLNARNITLLVNKIPIEFNMDELKEDLSNMYKNIVYILIPHSNNMMLLSSKHIYTKIYPNDEISNIFKDLSNLLIK